MNRELPSILTQLASNSLTSSLAPLPHLLILAHKADQLARGISAPSATTNSSNEALDPKIRTLAIERLKTVLTREMDRLKSARGSTSGRIEGISSIPSSTSSTWNPFKLLFGNKAVPKQLVLSEEGIEEAEAMIWGQPGRFKWEEVEGVTIDWAVSGLPEMQASNKIGVQDSKRNENDGLSEVRDWLQDVCY